MVCTKCDTRFNTEIEHKIHQQEAGQERVITTFETVWKPHTAACSIQ